ncbi:MAG: hypothetical protein IKL44_01485 [Clostridia bacterium]|nr:hypothetical protein [Clostridia bacterium]
MVLYAILKQNIDRYTGQLWGGYLVCTFFGHRNTEAEIETELRNIITDLIINKNVTLFYVGNNGRFDFLVRSILKDLKETHTHIKYYVVLAYLPSEKTKSDVIDFSDTVYFSLPKNTPPRFAIDKRNRLMIEKSDYVITHVKTVFGGAAKYKEIAEKKNKIVINI